LHLAAASFQELEPLLGHPDKVFEKPFVLACSTGPDDDIKAVFSSIADWFRAKSDLRRWIKSCEYIPVEKELGPNCVAAIDEIARNENPTGAVEIFRNPPQAPAPAGNGRPPPVGRLEHDVAPEKCVLPARSSNPAEQKKSR